jgi:hypothetical protein
MMHNWQRRREVRLANQHFVFDGSARKGEKKLVHES